MTLVIPQANTLFNYPHKDVLIQEYTAAAEATRTALLAVINTAPRVAHYKSEEREAAWAQHSTRVDDLRRIFQELADITNALQKEKTLHEQ